MKSNGVKWLRVTKETPCPVCAKPDWCLIAPDGKAAICARIESERRAGGAGWLHLLTDASTPALPPPKPKPETNQAPKAAPDVLDAAYCALLGELGLSAVHRSNLQRRGLTDPDINRLGYKSLPVDGRGVIVQKLKAGGLTLTGVPGFWVDAGKARLAGPAGMLIPVRDLRGRIPGLQIRRDQGDGGRYCWLSSKDFNGGCSSGAPVHVARPPQCFESGEVWITEGPIKADIVASKLGRIFLAVAGVGNWRSVVPLIRELKPPRVIVAYDQDKTTKRAVRLHTDWLIESLLKCGIRCFEADWNPARKGLDDLLEGVHHG